MRPAFSIVIPVFNRQDLISECIDSVLWQTFENFEVLVIDDASLDLSVSVASAYAQQDARINVLINSQNLGSQRSRNRGLLLAKGKYIVFLDSDDILSPHYLQIAHRAFSVFPWLKLFGVNCIKGSSVSADVVSFIGRVSDLGPCCEVDLRTFLNNNYKWPTSASIWNKNALVELGGWDESLKLWQDWNLNARFFASGQSALFFDSPLVFYRLTSDGLSRQKGGKLHIPYLRSRISAWKACRHTDIWVSHSNEWLNHFCAAVAMCRRERSSLRELILSAYYSILCRPSLRTVIRISSAWRAGTPEASNHD